MKKIAVMQPYLFPYIGYFQLIKAVDKFVFYDDVNFIKNGWINRNRILINSKPHYITLQLSGASPFELIKNIKYYNNRPKLIKTIEQAYKKAPYFKDAMPLIKSCLSSNTQSVCQLAIQSVKETCLYLGIKTTFEVSSIVYPDTKGLNKEDRLKEICKKNNASQYFNPIGGVELYNKEDFKKSGIKLNFIKTGNITYEQNSEEFVPYLSIIDIMMFNSPEIINKMLGNYELA